jgi:hypothetical protein
MAPRMAAFWTPNGAIATSAAEQARSKIGKTTMNEQSKLPPGREPLRNDWFVQQLGASQQRVMSLTVENRTLRNKVEKLENLLLENKIEW